MTTLLTAGCRKSYCIVLASRIVVPEATITACGSIGNVDLPRGTNGVLGNVARALVAVYWKFTGPCIWCGSLDRNHWPFLNTSCSALPFRVASPVVVKVLALLFSQS